MATALRYELEDARADRTTMTPIRVLLLIDDLGGGGAQDFIYHLCRHSPADSIQFSVCAFSAGGIYEERLRALGIPVHLLSARSDSVSVSFHGLAAVPSLVVRLVGLLRRQRYGIVHTFLQVSFALGTPVARLVRIPTVHSVMAFRGQTQGWYFPLMA